MTGKKGLIEELARLAGCTYVSDLHLSSPHRKVMSASEKIEKGRYSALEWCDAYEYVTGDRLCHAEKEQIDEAEVRRRFSKALNSFGRDTGNKRTGNGDVGRE